MQKFVKMNTVLILCALISLAAAAVVPEEAQAKIVKYENTNVGTGNYRFSFETSNGIFREETGRLVNAGQDDEHIVVEGSYSYNDPKGKLVVVYYKADQNGYQISKPLLATQVTYSLPSTVVASLLGK